MIKRFPHFALAVLLIVGTAEQSFGAIFGAGENHVFFNDRGVVLRPTPGSSYGGLANFALVDVSAGNLPAVGDIEIEIFQAQNIEAPPGNEVWLQSSTDRFQGYAAFEVQNIFLAAGGVLQVEFGPTTDPFGILAAGEILALYEDFGSTGWLPNAATLALAVSSVTNGTLWGTLGFSGTQGLGGYLYQRNDNAPGNPEVGVGYAALNFVQTPAVPGIGVPGINDPSESLFGSTTLLTDVWAEQKFIRNTAYPKVTGNGATSLFQFQSDDPLAFNVAVPEPFSLVVWAGLIGLGLAALSGRRRLLTA